MDPNTLNLDPDPGFWPNLDPDPGPELGNTINMKEKFKIILEKNNFLIQNLRIRIRKAPEYGSTTMPPGITLDNKKNPTQYM